LNTPPRQIVWFADGLVTRRQVFWTRADALKTARAAGVAALDEIGLIAFGGFARGRWY